MTTVLPTPLLTSYAPSRDTFDEMLSPAGRLREHWAQLAHSLEALGQPELERRGAEAARLLRDDGVTYNVYGELDSIATAWALDPIPLVVASDEWAVVEEAVAQRAELLDLVLTDLYGPRDLIRKGLLPPELVYGHRGFLRPADGIRLPGGRQLLTYAADLGRDPSGDLLVLGDFAQAPSGAGYALENRVVVSRVFPSLYRDAQVHRLAPFFRALRAGLAGAAPSGVDDPRIVLLTPGPHNETFFEHAYLAAHLGYSLVEGDDLTVRDGRVWLRSLGGLEPVDVILRRTDGWYCDPLELTPDSKLGVTGLVESARRGKVSVVNPLGSSVLENPGFLPFLPHVAQHLLGEPLRVRSITTWWCGDPVELSHVLANLEHLVIKPISPRPGRTAVNGWELTADQRDALALRIEAQPTSFVGQERVSFSSAPTLSARGLEAHHTVMRTFAVARDDAYVVMPGALSRAAPTSDTLAVSGQPGGLSKDTWVLASEPELQTGFWLNRGPGVPALDPAGSMPSRAAENLFWLGRYAERAEGTVRLLRTVLDRRNEFQTGFDQAGTECLEGLLAALTHLTATYPGFVGDGAPARLADPEHELLAVIRDRDRPGSLAFSVHALLAAANAVRDQLSQDTWLVVSDLERELATLDRPTPDQQAAVQAVLAGLVQGLLALAGLAVENMERDPGWGFMDAGRRLERSQQLLSLLRATLVPVRGTAAESLMLESVLVAAESIITYRRRYRSQAQTETLLDLLLLDEANPRSLAYQLARLSEEVASLPRPPGQRLSDEERFVLETSTELRLADTVELGRSIVDEGGGPRRADLDRFLATLAGHIDRAGSAIEHAHFTHLQPPQVLVALQPELPGDLLGGVMA